MHPQKTIKIALAVCLLLFLYSTSNSPVVSDETYTYIAELSWYNDFEEGQKVAVEQDKPMLVYFWATWCTYCIEMQTEVYPDPEVNRLLKEDFVLVAVDLDRNKEDADAFGVGTPPAEIFVTPEGDTIDRIGGYLPKHSFHVVLVQIKNYYGGMRGNPHESG